MGFLATDLTILSATGPTPTIPSSKDVVVKAFKVSRTDTTASIKCVLPQDASIIDFLIFGVASDAGTTATLSVGSTATANEFINGQDAKTAGGLVRPTATVSTALPNIQPVPLTGQDIKLYAKYAETGVASTTGGPWTVVVFYIR